MPRPSVQKQRKQEILKAYERCIALYGVEGATLQKIAEEAGIARPLLRHHVGNSQDLLDQAVTSFIARSEKDMADFMALKINKPDIFLDYLFRPEYSSDKLHNDSMIASALIMAASNSPDIKAKMTRWLDMITCGFENCLSQIFPKADESLVKIVTAGILGIYFNVEALVPIEDSAKLRNNSHLAAQKLLSLLN